MINKNQVLTQLPLFDGLNSHPVCATSTGKSGQASRRLATSCHGLTRNDGFSLVELSIVLVILGLLTGGILTGQNLIRAAELRAVTTELQAYQTAVMTFRDKYFALPGDMPNAADFWGYPGGSSANCPATAGSGTETCNGSDNGELEFANNADEYGETFMFWQHLANAGLISGGYTGIAGPTSGGQKAVAGENVPFSKLSPSVWYARHDTISGGPFFDPDDGNMLILSAPTLSIFGVHGAIMTAEEVWNIDTKIDDAKPGLGKVKVNRNACTHNSGTVPAASDEYNTAEYLLDDSGINCYIIFSNAY